MASTEALILCSQTSVPRVPAPTMAIAATKTVAVQDLAPLYTVLMNMMNGTATSTNISAKWVMTRL